MTDAKLLRPEGSFFSREYSKFLWKKEILKITGNDINKITEDKIKQQIKDTEDRINKEKKIALEDLDKEINASASLFIAKVTNQSSEEIKLS